MGKISNKQLLVYYLLELCTKEERREVETWLAKDENNVCLLQEEAGELGTSSVMLTETEKEQVKENILQQIKADGSKKNIETVYSNNYLRHKRDNETGQNVFFKQLEFWIKAAAVVTVILFASVGTYYYRTQEPEEPSIVWKKRTLPYGQTATLRFSDGSVVKLNGGSTLRYPKSFSQDKRVVYLKGEAFFSITHDEDHPFIVHAGDIKTRVLGTSFNIEAYKNEDEVQVTVAEGTVAVSKDESKKSSVTGNEKQIVLQENQWVTYHTSNKILERGEGDISEMIAWKNDVLVFHHTSFNEVARMLERWYGVKIILKDEQLGNMILEGKYEEVSLKTVLESIKFMLDVDYTMKEDMVTIYLNHEKQVVDSKQES